MQPEKQSNHKSKKINKPNCKQKLNNSAGLSGALFGSPRSGALSGALLREGPLSGVLLGEGPLSGALLGEGPLSGALLAVFCNCSGAG